MPAPIEPNSGLTITSPPSSSNASSASSGRSQAIVRGVGTPAAASSAEARNLSMVRSIARGPLTHGHAARDERVQRVDAEDHLLERAARDAADDHGVAAVEQTSRLRTATSPSMRPTMRVTGTSAMLVAARRERVGQLLRVPAAGRPQDRDGQPQNERSSTSRLTAPASKLRPLSTLVSLICAGLKSSGSIL